MLNQYPDTLCKFLSFSFGDEYNKNTWNCRPKYCVDKAVHQPDNQIFFIFSFYDDKLHSNQSIGFLDLVND